MATLPDGTSRTLISIPDWDLRWQHVYRYQTPVPLPKGTTVDDAVSVRQLGGRILGTRPSRPCACRGDSSRREEMGDFWLQVIAKNAARPGHARPDVPRQVDGGRRRSASNRSFGASPNSVQLRDDIAVLYMELNRPADAAHILKRRSNCGRTRRPPISTTAPRSPAAGRLGRCGRTSISGRSSCGPNTQSRTTTSEPPCCNWAVHSPRLPRSVKHHESILSSGRGTSERRTGLSRRRRLS